MEKLSPLPNTDRMYREINASVQYEIPEIGKIKIGYRMDYPKDLEDGKLKSSLVTVNVPSSLRFNLYIEDFKPVIEAYPFLYGIDDIPDLIKSLKHEEKLLKTIQLLLDKHFPPEKRVSFKNS